RSSDLFKLKVVEYMHDNHLSIRSTAKHFNIPQHYTVSRWERIYYEEGPAALLEERRGRGSSMAKKKNNNKNTLNKEAKEDLIAEVQRLRMENDYLKKLNALVQERISRENGKKPPSSKN
ncbi:MAG TPA: transposase, partial [Lachnoclostridium sp.]|nr:transposase [Lachnoclostridium sp.]